MATSAPQSCEQCNRHPSVLYCLTCAKHICLACEDSHGYSHSVVSTANTLKCGEHRLPFDSYCENCEKLVCATCYPRHASLQHIISAIQQVFRKKQNIIVSLMTEAAFEKKAAIQAQAARLTKRIHDLKTYKSVLESDVYQAQDQILSRLQTWVAPISQKLEKEREMLGRDLDALDSSQRVIDSVDKLQFLTGYRSVVATLETIAARPIILETEVVFEAMPREMQEIRGKVQESVMQRTINQARNDTIWDMLKNYPSDSTASDAATKREILQWSRLTDKLLQQVADLQFVCYLCKTKVAPESVNEDCSMNPVGVVKGELSRDPLIPPSVLGNGFHFIVSQNGDVRKQAERFRLAEQPRSKFQIQETAVGVAPKPRTEAAGKTGDYGEWKKHEADHGRGPSYGSDGFVGSPAPRPSGFQSGLQTGSDFGRTMKSGFNMMDTAAGSSFRQSYASPSQSFARRDDPQPAKANPNVVTFGGNLRDSKDPRESRDITDSRPGTGGIAVRESSAGRWESSAGYLGSGKFTESFGSSFNPVDSFGANLAQPDKPAAPSQRPDPSLSKEVRFSYSDSFKAALTPTLQPTATPKDPSLKSALKPALNQSTNWREKVKTALSAASAMFLSSCKTYDNGAGEIPIDGLRVCLHKASHLLTIEDIDQAAKYVGRDHVNYSSFLSAMTNS